MISEVKTQPVFVHSLFRAGSTYIFSVFRRSDAAYWCYQEPMSEFVLSARDERETMLVAGNDLAKVLRHPELQGGYYSELYSVSSECLAQLDGAFIYDGYFASTPEKAGVRYFSSLISSAQGRPFIQECRTASRIGVLKEALGGYHIYLWRNPWDQWWSYKVNHYFDDANQMILNGVDLPHVINRLVDEVDFKGFADGTIYQKFSWFFSNRLSPDKSYLVFYVLWFLGLREGLAHADLQINIDQLSNSPEYQQGITDALGKDGIGGLDFSDCLVPQAIYGDKDRAFFCGVEERAHGLLLLSGISQLDIDQVLALRELSEPLMWCDSAATAGVSNLVRDAERARELVLQGESREVELRVRYEEQLVAQREACSIAETGFVAAEAKAAEAESRVVAAEAKVVEAETRVVAAEAQVVEVEPHVVAAEAKVVEAEIRVVAAEAKVVEAETRVVAAEAKVVEAETRVIAAEARAAEAESRVVAAEAQVVEAEARVIAVEAKAAEAQIQVVAREVEAALVQAEAQEMKSSTKNQLQAVFTSTSWRLTRPIRIAGMLINGGMMFRGATMLGVKHRLKSFISYFIRSAVEKPVVKGWAVSYLARHPVLKVRLKRIAWGMQHHDSLANQPSIAKAEVVTSAELEFRLREKGINNELKSPLESFFY